MLKRSLLFCVAALAAAGCARGYTPIDNTSAAVDGALTVPVSKPWVDVDLVAVRGKNGERDQLWTLDGIALNTMSFFVRVADGFPLLTPQSDRQVYPVFRSSMSELELQDLFVDTYAQALGAGARPEVLALRPRMFSGRDGFELELLVADSDGLERRLLIAGATIDGFLTAMVYQAPRIHYFEKDLPEVRRMIDGAFLAASLANAS